MPIYGYRCSQCGNELEVLQGINDPPMLSCPECMGPMRKMLYPVGVIYKGSGYYSTDYKASSAGSAKGSNNGTESSTTSGDAKPAEKKAEPSSSPAAAE